MSTDIKFCGLTRAADVRVAVELGASFLGAVFASGPRAITAHQARSLFEDVNAARRVGVFGDQATDEIARVAEAASLDVVQLHADPTPEVVTAVKQATGLETWAAMRIASAANEVELDALISSADAILFDSRVAGTLGGTGRAFDWSLITNLLDHHRRAGARVVLAGGLTPALVPLAIAALRPDIVDVSSGVESSPGVKDHGLMRAFAAAVRQAR
jgi:phosphoribosylanthranilate isomerase